MKTNPLSIFLTAFLFLSFISCNRTTTKSCFDQKLYNEHKNVACPEHCPGVKGCDGKTYCNECIANSKGIRVVK